MGDIEPTDTVHPHRPLSKILTPKNLIPLFLQLSVCALIQQGSLFYLQLQDWQVLYCVLLFKKYWNYFNYIHTHTHIDTHDHVYIYTEHNKL